MRSEKRETESASRPDHFSSLVSHPPFSWLIIGLGNPGRQYAQTRHNLGARVVRALRMALGQPVFTVVRPVHARVSRGTHVLALPTTFMNASGAAAGALLRRYGIAADHLIVVHDDKDLHFGQLKIQRGRSSAGHRGVQSIIDTTQTREFWRVRIGIGSPPPGVKTDTFVLDQFRREEEAALTQTILPTAVALFRERFPPS